MPKKKYQKPLHVEVSFDENLQRFAQTEPAEASETARAEHDGRLSVHGSRVGEDEHGNICLNDLWSLAGEPANLRPANWHRQKRAQALERALQEEIMFQKHNPEDTQEIPTYYVTGRGGGAKTFAHPVLALDYSEALSPELGLEVKKVFLRYRANDISLANDILDRVAEQVEEDEIRVHNRSEITIRNRELAQEGGRAGCTKWDYAELHNSGYRGLYNGLDADGIHRLKGLTKNQKILDHMNAAEGAANVFRVTQAKIAMQQRRPRTPEEAFKITHDAGVETREAMKRIGGVMPEDMQPADALSKAKKRLKENKSILSQPEEPKKVGKKG